MGVYEVQPQYTPGMHWHHPERPHMLAAAYDPSRDLSPNLPTTCHPAGDSMSSSSTSCCSFKTEAEFTHPCRDCGHYDPASEDQGFCRKSCQQEEFRERREVPLQYHQVEPKQEPPPQPAPEDEDVVCAGCGRRISDRFYLFAVERRWHSSCLQCCQCRRALDGEITCFARDGNIYCKKDYYRLFGMKRCGRCQAAILASELVMRAREMVFHVHCFSCAVCQTVLAKGDTFGMRDGAVFCRLHYQELPPAPPPDPYPGDLHYHPRLGPGPTPPLAATPPHPHVDQPRPPAFFNGAPTPRQKGRPRKRKPKDLESMTANLGESYLNAEAYLDVAFGPGTPGMGANGSHHQRTKRMRTSFKHHQLRTMKSYFAINHNPDAKDLKQLSQKTGLPKRVLQVWFQNARAKWRRMMLKQESGGGKSGDKCGDGSGAALEAAYHLPPHGSPQHYLSPSPLECSS
ncbi:LIM/homeobox protein Lhx9-like isoform X2 [Macrosteles quadrilineatus]|uniref:LIM/homeobox protein Lhx9-like isoform X2 n=1 Tax=Macrosteles quadrilineatus TaxID=74068 RepID=UPI0023E09FC0|nr:LIM/homeobox protein Lhx9-like isoform X2 [Macrosteles quadrilineatus]